MGDLSTVEIKYSEEGLIDKIINIFGFFAFWSILYYIFVFTIHPFKNNLTSQIVYISIVIFVSLAWFYCFCSLFSTCRYVIRQGSIEIRARRFGLLRTERLYSFENIDRIVARYREVRSFLAPAYEVSLILRQGSDVQLRLFSSERQAEDFRSKVTKVFYGEKDNPSS